MIEPRITERRVSPRVAREFGVTFSELVMSEEAGDKYHSTLINISDTGILFESEKYFPKGTMLKLELKMERWEKFSMNFMKYDQTSVSRLFIALGTVSRVYAQGEGRCSLGVEFINTDESDREALKRYLSHLRSQEKVA